VPYGEGETIGFCDAQLLRVTDQRELNFVLTPFLSHQVPASMKVNAADFLKKPSMALPFPPDTGSLWSVSKCTQCRFRVTS
jgi:hypothetical protein